MYIKYMELDICLLNWFLYVVLYVVEFNVLLFWYIILCVVLKCLIILSFVMFLGGMFIYFKEKIIKILYNIMEENVF